jgi:hypothetical protein
MLAIQRKLVDGTLRFAGSLTKIPGCAAARRIIALKTSYLSLVLRIFPRDIHLASNALRML